MIYPGLPCLITSKNWVKASSCLSAIINLDFNLYLSSSVWLNPATPLKAATQSWQKWTSGGPVRQPDWGQVLGDHLWRARVTISSQSATLSKVSWVTQSLSEMLNSLRMSIQLPLKATNLCWGQDRPQWRLHRHLGTPNGAHWGDI